MLASTSRCRASLVKPDDLARAAGEPLADRLQRRLALLLDLDLDAAPVQPVLQVGERAVGVVDVARDLALERGGLVGDRVGEQEADADGEPRRRTTITIATAGAARDPQRAGPA